MSLPEKVEINFVSNTQESLDMIQWVKDDPNNREIMAFDLETSGLDPREKDAKIRLAQIGDHLTAWSVPWDLWRGAYMEALETWQGPLTGHNTSFDNRWLRLHAGWTPPYERLHDTMIMAQVCEPGQPAGLKALSDRHIDRKASAGQKYLEEAMKAQGWTWATVPVDFKTYYLYGGLDCILTAHIWLYYRADLEYKNAYELEMNARRVVSTMEDNGIRIDLPYCEAMLKQLKDYVDDSKKWAEANWDVNIGSPAQVAKLFTDRLGQSITRTTPSGAPSADKEQMTLFMESDDPTVSATAKFILDVKNADKKANSYFKNFINFNHDGVLHASFKTLGARTGRMSSTQPALQTISKADTVLRDAFLPHEGQVLLSCDYSQIELRLMCHFSGDQGLAEAFRTADATGGDFFVEMGKSIYGDPSFHKKDDRRNLIKTFMYAYLYGAKIPKMAKAAGVPEAEMEQFVKVLSDTYPGIPDFQKKVISMGEGRERDEGVGYVVTPFGRRLPCDYGQARTLVNYLLQGHASEILKDALVKLDAAGLGEYLLLPIHDEVIASVPPEEYEEVSQMIGEIMSIRGQYAVDIIAEPEGPFQRWGDKVRREHQ